MIVQLSEESIKSQLQYGIVVGEEDKGKLASRLTGSARCLHAGPQMDIAAERPGGSTLNDRSVCQWIGIRHTEFYHIGAGGFKLCDNGKARLEIGITYRQKRNQRRFALLLQASERQIHAVRRFSRHFKPSPSV
ncbi:hypothetical protein D3C71_1497310 [compost metagenome]